MIYFVRTDDPEIDRIKIGFTAAKDTTSRMKDIQTHSPCSVYVMAVIPNGTMAQESALHATFAADHIIGEWFHASEELVKFINNFTEVVDSRFVTHRPGRLSRKSEGERNRSINGGWIEYTKSGNKRYARRRKWVLVDGEWVKGKPVRAHEIPPMTEEEYQDMRRNLS